MDNATIKDVLLDKKLDRYSSNDNDFIASQEITVTITLSEYRMLVSNDATRQAAIDDANKDKYQREQQIKALSEENAKLKAELYELQKKNEKREESGQKVSDQ